MYKTIQTNKLCLNIKPLNITNGILIAGLIRHHLGEFKMKIINKLTVLFLLSLLLVIVSVNAEDKGKQELKQISDNISKMNSEYGDAFYKALFSIDEIRSYSIIQVDKISNLYNNNWISPNKILTLLDKKDKELLNSGLSEFIDSYSDTKKQDELLLKIRNWCNAEFEMNLLTCKMGLPEDKLIKALMKINPIIVSDVTGETINPTNIKNSKGDEQYYFLCLNSISIMTINDQLKYYSKLFNQLADLSQN
jgi:hypothetical protein